MEALNLFSHLVADNHPAVLEHLNTLLEDKIPSPPLGVEHEHDIAWYIFLQRFGDGEVRAQAFRAKIEVGFRRSIQAYTSDIEDRRNSNLPVDVGGAAWVLWLINQSFPLSRSLKLEAAKLAYALSTIQHADGCWRFDDTDWDDQNILNTALCLLVLYKFYKGRDLTERADRAATWLCLQQDPCGGWRESEVRSLSDEFDILTTAIARHALEMSGLPNWGGHVTRADAFLLSRQHPLGFWVQRPYWSQFVTSTVLMSVSVDHRSFPDSVENHHLKAARDFLTRGQELLETADTGNWPLGIVALYHGLEFLLYGCFVQLNPQISIWQLKQTSLTIGLRDALTAFRAWLAGHDVAGPPMPFEQQIRGLASLRDGVVHRGDEISPAARDQALRDAQGFVTTHAKVLLPPEVPIEAIWPGMVHKAREPS